MLKWSKIYTKIRLDTSQITRYAPETKLLWTYKNKKLNVVDGWDIEKSAIITKTIAFQIILAILISYRYTSRQESISTLQYLII